MSHSVDEHYGFYHEVQRTARKRHECCACEIPIDPGHRYTIASAKWDGSVREWKRCARCQFLHEQLREVCSAAGDWPDEDLNCGHTFEERWERQAPPELAALAFWQPGDQLPHVAPCTPSLRYDYERAIVYRRPGWSSAEDRCQKQFNPYWGIEGPRGPNPAHITPCTRGGEDITA